MTGRQEHLTLFALAAAVLALVFLNHGYGGIRHDGQIYTLQALAHLHPDLLGQDIYLRYGSQDRYTLFSPLYAALGGWLGMENAAAWITFGATLAYLAAAFALARCLADARRALIAVALLAALPDDYGSRLIFHCLENFVSPRLPAEALALAGLAALLSGRRVLALACLGAATLLHPIMALAGWAMAALLWLPAGWRWRTGGGVLGLAALATALLAWTPLGQALRFDAQWFQPVLDRNPYLFLAHWHAYDWSITAVTGATLLLEWRVLAGSRARTLAGGALLLGLAGLAATAIGCDGLRLVLVTQAQPWRLLWLCHVLAVLLAPSCLVRLWSLRGLGRAAALLLAALWLMRGEVYAFYLLPLVLASGAWAGRPARADVVRWAVPGAALALLLAAFWCLVNIRLLRGAQYNISLASEAVNHLRGIMADGLVPGLAVGALAWLAALAARGRRWATPTLLALAVAGWLAVAPFARAEWSWRETDAPLVRALARWQALVPPGAEVLLPESPVAVWLVLERRSYLSDNQVLSALFSREAAVALAARADALAPYLIQGNLMHWVHEPGARLLEGPITLAELCAHGTMAFVISKAALAAPPLDAISVDPADPGVQLRLYACPRR